MPIRRIGDPVHVQCIWDAINYIIWQKGAPEHQRVLKQLIRDHGYTSSEWEKHIKEALKDKSIEKATRKDVQIYKMPSSEIPSLDGRDWYCFECHLGGNVILCRNKSCHRVYHMDCISKSAVGNYRMFKNFFTNSDQTELLNRSLSKKRKSTCSDEDLMGNVQSNDGDLGFRNSYDRNLCIVCNMMAIDNFSLDKSELNHLFRFVLHRIRSWIPINVAYRMEGRYIPVWQTFVDLTLRSNHLFFEHKDMSVIEVNINNESYQNCYSLLSDILAINHNIGIYHGVDSQEYEASQFVLRDALYDLGEIICCVDCYKHSNEMINVNWFSLPCRKAHEIVWAKQKGYCYWPAKVIKESEAHYDVRFFGGRHERAVLTKQFIKPITVSKETLQLKKSFALSKAIEEMELHQKLSQNPLALEAFIATSKKKISLPKQWTSPIPGLKKSRASMPANIAFVLEEEKPPVGNGGRSSLSRSAKKELIISTELPNLSERSGKKRGRHSLPIKKDRESPEIGMEVPVKKNRGRLPKKEQETPEIGAIVNNVPEKKRRSRRSSKKVDQEVKEPASRIRRSRRVVPNPTSSNQQNLEHGRRKTRSVSKIENNVVNGSHVCNAEDSTAKEQNVESVVGTRCVSNILENLEALPDTPMDNSEVINISDSEDNTYTFSGDLTTSAYGGSYEQLAQVTSSTEFKTPEQLMQSQEMHQLDHPFSDEVEMMRRTLEQLPNKKEIIKCSMRCMQAEIDRITEKHNDHLKKLFESHNSQISDTKKKQWCYYCEQDAIYHCCWNTAYCSTTCQQQHWETEHKKVCRRKR